MNHQRTFLSGVKTLALLLSLTHAVSDDWVDSFDRFNQENWTTQPSGLRLAEEAAPHGVTIKDGALALDEPLRGVRLTSRRKFVYGILEARVKISPRGYQYIGFMSRTPWGANTIMCMSVREASGWHLMLSRERKGGHSGIAAVVRENQWCNLKIVWEESRAALYVDGKLKGEILDPSRIPQTPIPIILDAYPKNPMYIDWLRVSGETTAEKGTPTPPHRTEGKSIFTLSSEDWRIVVDQSSCLIRDLYYLRPTPRPWTPPEAAGIDLYIRSFPNGAPVRFVRENGEDSIRADPGGKSFNCKMTPKKGEYRSAVSAELNLRLDGRRFCVSARVTAVRSLDNPVEIGLGLPFRPEAWRRQIFPRLPWLALSTHQEGRIRMPFLADTNDATVPSATGNWIFYPMGLLEGGDRTIFWGGMDLGERTVLSPNNYGSLPAVTLAPKRWPKGKTLKLSLTMRGFAGRENDLPGILRWYLSNCRSSDPLTHDLFPVRDWTPRRLSKAGGVAIYDSRISHADPKSKRDFSDRVEKALLDSSLPNLWLGGWHSLEGSYPVAGKWRTVYGRPLDANTWRSEVARLKEIGLRPYLYVFQFIVPEVCKEGGRPDRSWVSYNSDGNLSMFDRYVTGERRGLGDWFTKEVADKIGTNTVTLAFGDFGNDDFRRWYTEQIKAAIDYYRPSGVAFDFGWAVLGPQSVYSSANPRTSQAHGRLRVQADIWKWIRERHPEARVIINDIPGSPSQLFANCMLLENSDTMSDLNFLAGKALGSAMSSMDYFADHDRKRWTRQAMLDVARGCSFGAPFWILTSPPESKYIRRWKRFLDFAGKTTRLPLLPQEDAVSSISGESDIVGTVWSDGSELMAAAFDRREQGDVRELTLRVRVPKTLSKEMSFRLSRLSSNNVEISGHGWKVDGRQGGTLQISGSLAPGEIILIEAATLRRF